MYYYFVKLQISWPDDVDAVGDEVDVDEWWESIDMRMVEGAAAASCVKAPVIKVENVAPWIPPICRNTNVVNSEVQKGMMYSTLYFFATKYLMLLNHVGGQNSVRKVGSPKKLADLIRNGSYNPETLKTITTETLRGVCNAVEIPIAANATKVYTIISTRYTYN